jgi:ligand-binding sensor domain-containing protein
LCFGQALVSYPGIQHFTPENGLPSSEVYDIVQDKEGYIWISTDQGVCRFDGYEFECFGKEDGLGDPVVLYLWVDYRGWIWMATYQGEFYIYKDGLIESYPYTELIKSVLSTKPPRTIINFFLDEEGILYAFYPGTGIIQSTPTGEVTLEARIDNCDWLMLENNEQVRFFFNTRDVHTIQDKRTNRTIRQVMLATSTPNGYVYNDQFFYESMEFPAFHQNGFIQERADEVLFQLADTLYLINRQSLSVTSKLNYPHGMIGYYLKSRFSDRVYVGHFSRSGGLRVYPSNNAIIQSAPMANVHHLFKNKVISHLFEDHQKGLWVATNDDGVYYISHPDLFFATVPDIRLNAATGLALQSEDSCFVMVKGIDVYAIGKDFAVEELRFSNNMNKSYAPKLYYDDVQGRLYRTGKLSYWENGQWHKISFNQDDYQKWYSKTDVVSTYDIRPSQSDDNKFFFFGNHYFYSAQRDEDSLIFSEDITVLEPRQRPFCIHQSQTGELLVGAMQGLYLYDEEKKAFGLQDQHPSLKGRIFAIEEFEDSTLVIATRFEGIVLLKGGQVRHISADEGLTSASIGAIHIDDQQILWVGTSAGLNRIHIQSFDSIEIKKLDISDGLPSNEIKAINSYNNQLWVATMQGIVKLPKEMEAPNPPVVPKLKRIYVNGVLQNSHKLKYLNWRENNIQFEIASIDFPQKGRITYRYRLAKSKDWQIIQNPIINIANLSFGNYQFEIQSKGSDGTWSGSAFFTFKIKKPFWRSSIFQILVVILLLGGGIWWGRREQLKRDAEYKREQQISQMAQQVENLRQQAYRAQMNPHFIFNCLAAIQSFMLQEETDKLVASDYLTRFSLLIRQALNASRNNMVPLAEDMKMLDNYIKLEQFRFDFHFDYEIIIDNNLDTYNESIPPMLVQPYVENAIIHGFENIDRKGFLQVTYKKIDDLLEIVVQDNGSGIYQTQQKKQQLSAEKNVTHHSMGMEISKQRLLIQSANTSFEGIFIEEIKVDNKVKGTRIKLIIPLG